jgi:hypothetical protein
MAGALPAAKQQDQAGEARLRMDVDAGEIDRLHLRKPPQDAEGHLAGLDIGEPVLSEQRREVLKSLRALAEWLATSR